MFQVEWTVLLSFLQLKDFFEQHYITVQKESSRGVLRKSCSENMHQIFRRTHMPNMISIKLSSTFNVMTLWHECSPVNLLHEEEDLWRAASDGNWLLRIALYIKFAGSYIYTEVALQSCSLEKVCWKYAANLLENTHTEEWNHTSAWVFSHKFAAYFQNTFS